MDPKSAASPACRIGAQVMRNQVKGGFFRNPQRPAHVPESRRGAPQPLGQDREQFAEAVIASGIAR